jgi:hypothetical protein
MSSKIKVNYNGKEVDASPIEINQENSSWNTYLLEDQSVLKLKVVLTKAVRLDGEYDGEGNPIYMVQSTNIVKVDSPDSLKKK